MRVDEACQVLVCYIGLYRLSTGEEGWINVVMYGEAGRG